MIKNHWLLAGALITISLQVQAGKPQQPDILNGDKLAADQVPQMNVLAADSWRCSATLVGPKVIVTAAHCVENSSGQSIVQKFGPINGKFYTATLTRHPDYSVDKFEVNIPDDLAAKNDIAIGMLDKEVTDVTPISVTKTVPAVGEMVWGFGCGKPTNDRQYGTYKIVTVGPLGATVRGQGDRPQIGAPGDSGGPNVIVNSLQEVSLFAVSSTSTTDKDAREETKWPEALPYTEGIARLFPAQDSGAKSFIEDYVKANSLKVCGLNLDCAPVHWAAKPNQDQNPTQ